MFLNPKILINNYCTFATFNFPLYLPSGILEQLLALAQSSVKLQAPRVPAQSSVKLQGPRFPAQISNVTDVAVKKNLKLSLISFERKKVSQQFQWIGI